MFGAIGIVWAFVWYALYRDNPAEHPRITPQELKEIGTHGGPDHRAIPWGRLFRSPQIWLVMCMYSSYVWGSTFYLYWLHTYLVKRRGFSEAEMKWYSTLPFVLGAFANPLGGVLSDLLSRRVGLKLGRRIMGSTCLAVGAAFMLATGLTTGKTRGIVLLALGVGALDMYLPSAWAVCMDLGGKYAGAVSGAMNSFGHIGGSLCTSLFGYLVVTSGSYNVPLLVIAANVALAAVLFAFIDASKPLVAEEAEPSHSPVVGIPLLEAKPCA